MKERFVAEIITEIKDKLTTDQLDYVKYVILSKITHCTITFAYNIPQETNIDWDYYLNKYLDDKTDEGLSSGSIDNYKLHLSLMLKKINKNIKDISDIDLSGYLHDYKEERKISNGYLNNIRHVFNSFFSWCQIKKIIIQSPMIGIRPFKTAKKIKKPFTGEQLEILRSNCVRERDLAMLEVLYSTAIRVSELKGLNKSDINFSDVGITVLGKGNKERETYLNPKSFYHLKKYLESRTDNNEALFVSIRKPYNRLTKAGIEHIFTQLGLRTGVSKVHPHRFRRTAATDLLRAGMPLEEVKEYLGHEKIDTTMIYCTINQDNIKNSHQKYMNS